MKSPNKTAQKMFCLLGGFIGGALLQNELRLC
ncbi:hypothetical protein ABB02_00515 [Clostridiaceae bacterium JG1575]|nr:hypothetical protein ABB02_00676 [Clostridiaceae bacterium JG1575]PKK40196.1 hypothetical protein ABB02_00515 [Clostridiaceae bacterium JG1575]